MVPRLSAAGVAVHLVHGRGRGTMHDKFAIFDGRLLVTYENALFLDDPRLAARYTEAFDRLFGRPALSPTARSDRSRPRPAARSSGS